MSDQSSGSRARNTTVHDIVTGGVEGGVGVLALEPLLQKLKGAAVESPFRGGWKPSLKRVGSGAVIGAGATGLIGALVSMTSNKAKRKKTDLETLAAELPVIELRRDYVLSEDEEGNTSLIKVPGDSKAKAALKGGLIGAVAGGAAGAGLIYGAPRLAEAVGAGPALDKLRKAFGNRVGTKAHAALISGGLLGKIGATVGAIQGVSDERKKEDESRAIARAIRKARQSRTQMSAQRKLIEFAYEEDLGSPNLRRSYRYDSYRKRINAREIDRKTANITRAGLLGGAVGAALPLKASAVHRAAIGAATGVIAEGGLTFGTHKDPYGDQTESAKIVQSRAPTAAAIAGLGTAAALRAKKIRAAFRSKAVQNIASVVK